MRYTFDPEKAFHIIKDDWTKWANKVETDSFVFGVSGGKDSTVVAYLAAKIFGPENCYGVMMPNGVQKDINDSLKVCKLTQINSLTVDIKHAYQSLNIEIMNNSMIKSLSNQAAINLAPRLRMATLYAVAQSVDGFVVNTDNLSERILGWSTLWGDSVGDYAPIQDLTKTEVVRLGEWLGIPNKLIHKEPSDGLCGKSDEDKMEISYAFLDDLIRKPIYHFSTRRNGRFGSVSLETCNIILKYISSQYKRDAIHLSGPKFNLPFKFIDNIRRHYTKSKYKNNQQIKH